MTRTMRDARNVCVAFFVCAATLFFVVPYANAQVAGLGSTATIEISPRYPGPGETFTARLGIYDATPSSIAWYVDGELVETDSMTREVTLQAPSTLGDAMTISVRTDTSSGPRTLNAAVVANDVDLIVEGDTIAPYFYEGRRVPSAGAIATLVAVPHLYTASGARVATSDLTFTWSINNTIAGEGRGMDRFALNVPSLQDVSIRLRIEGAGVTYETVFPVPRAEPAIVFYPVLPLRGLSQNAVQDAYFETDAEATIRAEPYFIARDVYAHAQHGWQLDGTPVDNQSDDPGLITLRGERSSTSDIGFSVRNLEALSQYASGLFRIVFGS